MWKLESWLAKSRILRIWWQLKKVTTKIIQILSTQNPQILPNLFSQQRLPSLTDEAGSTLREEQVMTSLEAAHSEKDASSPHATSWFLLDLSQMSA